MATAIRNLAEVELQPWVAWSVDAEGRYTMPLSGTAAPMLPPVAVGDSVWERLAGHSMALHLVREALAGAEGQLDTHIRGLRWVVFASPLWAGGRIVGAHGTCWLVDTPPAAAPAPCYRLDRHVPGLGGPGDVVTWVGQWVLVTPLRPSQVLRLPPDLLSQAPPPPPAEQPPAPDRRRGLHLV